ncbi:MAG TPA: flagellar hook capping FlgD N-terminal domain-containing protein [Phenylobacterium sp.]|jgi:flagellar basal-body rod modification protein FlgD|nr:flagellar hook capping FlgD N-terminal domain-containing protein [Phenylobacterium sp.]
MTTTSPTTATPPPATTSNGSSATSAGLDSLTSNFNTFLTLLTTQLQNQDPTAPLDSNQFTQQLVQMTGVQQQLNTNSLLQQVVTNTSGGVSTAVSLIGKQVKATSDTANLNNGQAQWTYNLASGATDLKVQVVDANGTIVNSVAPTDLTAGDKSFTWNGKDLSGAQLPNGGAYTLKITASDSKGAQIATTAYVQGVVTGVTQSNGIASIIVNGGPVNWANIVSVNQAPTGS